ncbi:MAG: hypothetical protein LBU69_03340 [Deltaproteobacteria bacterium]|jgi:hypothetical protein|nr:hypothetical protein [Deltaproteobacteria bacterium]
MSHENDFEIHPAIQEQIDEVGLMIIEHFRHMGTETDIAQIKETVKIVLAHQQQFDIGTSDVAKFMDINQIEQMILDLNKDQKELNFKILLEKMKNIKAESEIVSKKERVPAARNKT